MPGTRKLGKPTAARMAMLRQQVTDLLDTGRMETTVTRAKEIRPLAEKMITLGKKKGLANYRLALRFLTREDVDNINGVGGGMGPDYGAYYRVPAGSTSEHTAYTDGQHVLDAIDRAGFSKNHRSQYWEPNHFQFVNASNPNTLEQYSNAVAATEIDMTKAFPVTQSALTYNESDHKYYKRLYGNAQCDAVTGTQLAFDNVIIQNTYYERRDDHGYLAFQMHDTTRDGYFITRGKMIHVTWRKEGDYKPTRYFDDNGNEIILIQDF